MSGIPFIGEGGYYPTWAKGSGRWIFQRTLVSVGGLMAGYAELAAASLPVSDQVIVWVPRKRGFLFTFLPGALHEEREAALHELMRFRLICFGPNCKWTNASPSMTRAVVHERGLRPEEWGLECPECRSVAGPDLAPIRPEPIVGKWISVGRPPLEFPGASAAFGAAAPIRDLPTWIAKSEPSHLELAYLGQQMWATISDVLEACASN